MPSPELPKPQRGPSSGGVHFVWGHPPPCTSSTGSGPAWKGQQGWQYVARASPTGLKPTGLCAAFSPRFQGLAGSLARRRLCAGRTAPTSSPRSQRREEMLPAGAGALGSPRLGARGTGQGAKQLSLVGGARTRRAPQTLVGMTKIQHRRNPLWASSESPHFHLLKQHFYYKEMLTLKMDKTHFRSPIDFPGRLQLQRY